MEQNTNIDLSALERLKFSPNTDLENDFKKFHGPLKKIDEIEFSSKNQNLGETTCLYNDALARSYYNTFEMHNLPTNNMKNELSDENQKLRQVIEYYEESINNIEPIFERMISDFNNKSESLMLKSRQYSEEMNALELTAIRINEFTVTHLIFID
ncbi:hypothetical protein MXB_3921 [Myxobolus squamalis]|nr:hypothetical protein MXB_3921 [Myxobolus squamalis]